MSNLESAPHQYYRTDCKRKAIQGPDYPKKHCLPRFLSEWETRNQPQQTVAVTLLIADISSFKLQQVIGKGGFGLVRIVTKRDTKQKYALKYINKQKCIRKQSVKNIFRERVILEKCDHPFIINLHFAFQDYENMFMILDLATGGDLRFHLTRLGNLPNQTVRLYAAEISSALHYLHSNKILHRLVC